jgi:purine-binding chemotaxis protein CheW
MTTDGELYAVDVALVQKVVRNIAFTPIPAAPEAVVGIANLKGRIVTVLSLAELLGRKRGLDAVNAVVFKPEENSEDRMGLLIDKPGDLIDIAQDDIQPPPLASKGEENPCVSGVAEVDGKLYRIIDVNEITNSFKKNGEFIPEKSESLQGGVSNGENI